MSRYNQYSNYYDPVGSQAHHQAGYTYQQQQQQQQQQATSASSFPSGTASSGYADYANNAYGNQQYATGTGEQSTNSTNHAAAALSSLSGQGYSQTSNQNRASGNGQMNDSSRYGSNSNAYGSNNANLPNRSQSNNSPLYANTQASSTFGRLSVPQQSQSSSTTFGGTQTYQNAPSSAGTGNRYQPAQTQQQQDRPQRYNSPLHAVQAQQQEHVTKSSRGASHQPCPRMAESVRQNANRQQSASVEPSQTTVNPSQVYDNRAELQRKAQIDAEKRRKYEVEQAAKKTEDERVAEEQRKADAEKQRVEQEAAAKKGEQDRKVAERKKAREEKKQSKSAATTLQQMASAMDGSAEPPANDEEAEMRAMFKKMREFNSKNPAMLAKLWEEERKSHASPPAARAAPAPPAKAPAKASAKQKTSIPASATAPAAGSTGSAAGVRPFQKPNVASPTTQKATQLSNSQQQARPVSGQAETALWPPHKKGSLAEATARWLMSLPQNAGKSVNLEVVLSILNGNPSYVQLCESLEGLGLRFERSTLARELLKAVPDGLKAQPAPRPTAPLGAVSGTAMQINGSSKGSPDTGKKKGRPKKDAVGAGQSQAGFSSTTGMNYEVPLSLSEAAREVNSMDKPIHQTANAYGGPVQPPQQSPYFSQSQTHSNLSRPQSQSQPPDIKDEGRPKEPSREPADKEEAARKRTFGDLVDLTAEDSDEEGPPKKIMQPPSGPANGVVTQQQQQYLSKPTTFKQFMYNSSKQPEGVPQGQSYNVQVPSTSQSVPPPGQQAAFATQPPPKPKGPTNEQLQQSRLRGRMLVEPIMRDRVARKSTYDSRTIARDVLLATGRHPDMRGLNGHLAPLQKLLGQHGGETDIEGRGNRSDLSTIRWDIIDPVPSKEEKANGMKKTEMADDADDEDETTGIDAARSLSRNALTKYAAPSTENNPTPKKRGRPPRYSLPDQAALTHPKSATPNSRPPSARPATPATAPANKAEMSSSTGAIGYSAFNQLGPDGKKKKGRPFGWKKDVHSRAAQGLEPKTAPSKSASAPKLPKPAHAHAQKEPVEPRYQVYKCRWEDCGSELHNLETLKKHILKVHGKLDEETERFECEWKHCDAEYGFGSLENWMGHVDKAHLAEVKWTLGDGPAGDSRRRETEYSSPSYLLDSHGRSVTPVISPTPPPQHLSNTNDALPTVKRVGRPPKDGIPKSERDALKDSKLDELEQHKKAVGAVLDRTGCVLASEERRKGFLDDEDFEDEVYGSEHDDLDETRERQSRPVCDPVGPDPL